MSHSVRIIKRMIDVVTSTIGLAVALPFLPLIAAAIYLESPGMIFVRQLRAGELYAVEKTPTGRGTRPRFREFRMLKFRSMKPDAEKLTGPVLATEDDPRVTRVGAFLRRTHLDEVPQFWNVLVGDMSLVGPRPERPEFVSHLTRDIRFYGQRNVVRPGVTGWAQVCYTYGASVEDAMQKLQYDLFYIKNLSLALDLFILFSTLKTVIQRKGA